MDMPEFLQIGAIVKCRYWYGEVLDICQSETRCMVLLASPQILWRGKETEWVEYEMGTFAPATLTEALTMTALIIERLKATRAAIQQLTDRWVATEETLRTAYYEPTMTIADELQRACRHYWTIRNSGELGDTRTQAHDDLLSLFDALRIPYADREDAALLARDMQNGTVSVEVLAATITEWQKERDNVVVQETRRLIEQTVELEQLSQWTGVRAWLETT